MAEETTLESGSSDGYSVPIVVQPDEASFQKAKRNVSGLEEGLKALAKVDLSSISASIKTLAAAAGGVIAFTVQTNTDEVQNILKAAKAGLTNEDFKRWTSIEMQLGLNKGALTKDLAEIYSMLGRLRTKGDLNKEQFLSLGLTGTSAEAFLNEQDMTKRVMMVMDLAMKSDRPLNETAALLNEGLGNSFGDLFYMLKMTGKSFDELFGKMTVFTGPQSQSNAAAFNSELKTAQGSIEEMGRLLASTLGAAFTPFLERFNQWVRDYKDILTEILTFGENWHTKALRIVAGAPQQSLRDIGVIQWLKDYGTDKYQDTTLNQARNYDWAKYNEELLRVQNASALLSRTGRVVTMGEAFPKDSLPPVLARQPFLGGNTLEKQRAAFNVEFNRLENDRVRLLFRQHLEPLMVGVTKEGVRGYKPGADYSGVKPFYMEQENRWFDEATILALDRYLESATPAQRRELENLFLKASSTAVEAGKIPGMESFGGQKILTEESFKAIFDFILKQVGGPNAGGFSSAPIQQTNSISMSFPGVTTREQGEQVGEGLIKGLGQALGNAFRINDLSMGALG